MSVDILGTNCDQCVCMVQCCFTSTVTIRLIRTGSPGRPPRLSHSWTLLHGYSHGPVYRSMGRATRHVKLIRAWNLCMMAGRKWAKLWEMFLWSYASDSSYISGMCHRAWRVAVTFALGSLQRLDHTVRSSRAFLPLLFFFLLTVS